MKLIRSSDKLTFEYGSVDSAENSNGCTIHCLQKDQERWSVHFYQPTEDKSRHRFTAFFGAENQILLLRDYENSAATELFVFMDAVSYEGEFLWSLQLDCFINTNFLVIKNSERCILLDGWRSDRRRTPGKLYVGCDLLEIDLKSGKLIRRVKVEMDTHDVFFIDQVYKSMETYGINPFSTTLVERAGEIFVSIGKLDPNDPFKRELPVSDLLK